MDPKLLNELIRERRSIFQNEYTGDRVDEAIIKQILENANWAPNHKLTEPWRFIVFTGKSLLTLGKLQSEYYKKVTAADNTFRQERFENLRDKPLLSSHVIVVGMKRDPKQSVPEIEEVGAVFCAIQNMYLTASAFKVGCYLSTGGITYFPEASSVFGWENDTRLIGFLHIGIPKNARSDGKRKPIEEKVTWHH